MSKLLSSKFDLEPPSIFGGEPSQVVCDFAKIDRSSVTPNTIRVLLAHYDRCISPLYLVIFSSFLTETETPLKHLTEFERFKVLIASGIAAAHKSYHDPNWRTIAKVCREWAGDLAVSIIAARDAEAVVALLLLLIYELADPDKCVIWELLGFATRICLELGWHRILQSNDEDLSLQDDEQGFSDYHKRQLMSVLHSIERYVRFGCKARSLCILIRDRRLRVIFHRPSMLSGCQPPSDYQDNMVFETYMEASSIVSGIEFFEGSNGCPESGRISALISTLETLPSENELVQETWLLFLPLCLEHIECGLCSKTSDQAPNTTMTNLQLKVLSCAVQLANSVHPSVSSPEVFMPPLVASTQAFMSGCVIVAGLTNRWPGTETSIGALLKCSETLSFFAPLWIGGSDYHEVWRKIVSVV